METLYKNIETPLQFNIPKSQAGKISDVYYTVTKLDETGAPVDYIPRTQAGIIENGNGAYTVLLTFGIEGSYNISWELDGPETGSTTPYVGNDAIVVLDNYTTDESILTLLNTRYSGIGTGNGRNTAEINVATTLQFQFLLNSDEYSAYQVLRVEIYPTYEDAIAETNIIETIDGTGDIDEVSTGLYSYTASALSSPATYYDKIFLIPTDGDGIWDTDDSLVSGRIKQFYVRQDQPGGSPPSDKDRVRVFLNIFDIVNTAQKGDTVKVKMNVRHAWYGQDIIKQEVLTFKADAEGIVYMDLIETDTLTEDSDTQVYYEFNVAGKANFEKRVPAGPLEADFKDLPGPNDT
jgi:hypothetical protein